MFCKKGILKNSTKFTWKYLCQSLFFNKIAGLRPATLLIKRQWHRCFPANFVKFLRTPFFIEHLWWLLLKHINSKDGSNGYSEQKQPPEVFCKEGVLNDFAKFTGKHMRRSLPLIELGSVLFYRTPLSNCLYLNQRVKNSQVLFTASDQRTPFT